MTMRAEERRQGARLSVPTELVARDRTEHARRVAALCASLATGLEVWARHAGDAAANAFATEVRHVVEEALHVADASRPGVRTCERMRWEWLIATGTAIDGAPHARFHDECLRLFSEACDHASHVAHAPLTAALSRLAASLPEAWP
jgi:hypothetical protein